jgi:hypothetical protein
MPTVLAQGFFTLVNHLPSPRIGDNLSVSVVLAVNDAFLLQPLACLPRQIITLDFFQGRLFLTLLFHPNRKSLTDGNGFVNVHSDMPKLGTTGRAWQALLVGEARRFF